MQKLRRTSVVQVEINGQIEIAEIQYYFKLTFGDISQCLCVASVYSRPDSDLWERSIKTVYACRYKGQDGLVVFDVTQIKAVVAMIPFFKATPEGNVERLEGWEFLVEKPGLVQDMLCRVQEDDEGDDDE
ncbi:hypothetical protein VKT23_014390 [Stygiomarasmius scandens]|uniref:Uncharacterized protein n=1 Tax=Marasmiellus scandens TaxID=2682957 RepID=A0ABR1J3W2_9AGAR